MNAQILDPLARMKPQRGRNPDQPAPVMHVPAPAAAAGIRWRLLAFTTVASAAGAAICVTVASMLG
ncbi:MAG: hypothetical protein ABI939_00265 [Anaerolineaceae bacterium]